MLKNPVAEAPNPRIHDLMPILDRDKSGTVRYPAGMKAFTWSVPRALAATRIDNGQATSRSDRYLFPTRLIFRWIQPLSGEAEAYNISHSLGDGIINPFRIW